MADAMADEAQKPGLNASHAAVNAQGLTHVTLIPRPSDDPRDPLVSSSISAFGIDSCCILVMFSLVSQSWVHLSRVLTCV